MTGCFASLVFRLNPNNCHWVFIICATCKCLQAPDSIIVPNWKQQKPSLNGSTKYTPTKWSNSNNRRAFCDKTVSKVAYSMDPLTVPKRQPCSDQKNIEVGTRVRWYCFGMELFYILIIGGRNKSIYTFARICKNTNSYGCGCTSE